MEFRLRRVFKVFKNSAFQAPYFVILQLMEANIERLFKDIEALTSIYPYRNYKNTESLKKAADYIKKELNTSGLPYSTQHWDARGNTYENIIASYQPKKKQRLIIGAHYDIYKDQPGADDNASGVAGVLELTRLLQDYHPALNYGIDIVAFCLEEPPFFRKKEMGSYVHAQSLAGKSHDILGMIALEMIGYYTGKPGAVKNRKELIVSGIRKFDHFNKKVSNLLKISPKLNSRRLAFADKYKNNGPSDHRNYWPFGIPAVMIIGSGGNGNPNYHKVTDTIETLDFETLKIAVESIANLAFNFSP